MNYFIESIKIEGSNDPRLLVKNTQQTLKYENLNNENETNSRIKFTNDDKNIIYEILDNKFPPGFNDLKKEDKYDLANELINKHFPNDPESLRAMTAGFLFCENIDRLPHEIPLWLDCDKVKRGQKFALDNLAGLLYAEFLSLFFLFSFEDGLKPMIITEKSSEPYTAFKRYLSTTTRIRNWYKSDPWVKGTPANKDIQAVKNLHQLVRNKVKNMTQEEIDKAAKMKKTWSSTKDILTEDFRDTCPMALPGQCPYSLNEAQSIRPKGLNQGDMSATQGAFVCLMVLFPDRFGAHGDIDADLDAFCHLWRGIGYLLGIDDKFNFCRGSLDDVRKRCREFVEYWMKPNFRDITPEWEHMMRCVHEGQQYYFPTSSYEVNLLFLTELMELNMPRLRSVLTVHDWIMYYMTKFIMRYPIRIPQVKSHFNESVSRAIDRAIKYNDEKHEILRQKSSKTLAKVLTSEPIKNKQSFNNTDIFSHHKYIGLMVPFLLIFISWKINSLLVQF